MGPKWATLITPPGDFCENETNRKITAKFRTLGQEKKKYIQRKLNLTTSTHHLGIICAKQGENQVISVLKSHAI